MGALTIKTLADLRRRRLQTVTLAVVLFLASGAATLALSVLDVSRAPFDHAFVNTNGAHLVIHYASSVDEAQLTATKTTRSRNGQRGSVAGGRRGSGDPRRVAHERSGRIRPGSAGRVDRQPDDQHGSMVAATR